MYALRRYEIANHHVISCPKLYAFVTRPKQQNKILISCPKASKRYAFATRPKQQNTTSLPKNEPKNNQKCLTSFLKSN